MQRPLNQEDRPSLIGEADDDSRLLAIRFHGSDAAHGHDVSGECGHTSPAAICGAAFTAMTGMFAAPAANVVVNFMSEIAFMLLLIGAARSDDMPFRLRVEYLSAFPALARMLPGIRASRFVAENAVDHGRLALVAGHEAPPSR